MRDQRLFNRIAAVFTAAIVAISVIPAAVDANADEPAADTKQTGDTSAGTKQTDDTSADDIITGNCGQGKNGTVGDNVKYTFNKKTGVLTISGKGKMHDWNDSKPEYYSSINGFNSDYSAKIVVIEDGVTSIGSNAFSGFKDIDSVSIADGVTEIGDEAFCGSIITSINIPDSVKRIGVSAFAVCSHLSNVTLPDSVTKIDDYAFYNSPNVILSVPDTVKSIGKEPFWLNLNVSYKGKITPSADSDYAWGARTFNGYTDDSGLWYSDSAHTVLTACPTTKSGDLTIPDTVTEIGDWTFNNCKDITSITIPSSVTKIVNFAIYGCENLTSIVIPDSVTNIGNSAFMFCRKLSSVTLPKGLTSIEDGLFDKCRSLTSVTIPDNVTSIGRTAFSECSNLTSVVIPTGVRSIGGWAFNECTNLTSVTIPYTVKSIGEKAFDKCNADLTISGYSGTFAEKYASENNLKFNSLGPVPENVVDTGSAITPEPDPSDTDTKTPTDKALINKIKGTRGTVTKATPGKKNLTVKAKKVTIDKSVTTGYQYAIRQSGTKRWKNYNTSKTSKKISKLKSKKKYQVRVRPYIRVKGKTYYGKWSGTKTVKVK